MKRRRNRVGRGCIFSGLEKKRRKFHVFFFSKIDVQGPKKSPRRVLALPPSSLICQFPSHQKSTPLASIAHHLHVARAILASQSHRGNIRVCDCEAGIVICAFPYVYFTPNHVNPVHDDTILDTIVTNRVLDKEGRCHHQQKDSHPLPKTPPNTSVILYGVGEVRLGCRLSFTHSHPKISTLHQWAHSPIIN